MEYAVIVYSINNLKNLSAITENVLLHSQCTTCILLSGTYIVQTNNNASTIKSDYRGVYRWVCRHNVSFK